MRYSGRTDRDEEGPWFSIGQLEVTTSVFVVLLWAITTVIYAIEPVDKPIMRGIAMTPTRVEAGQVYRLVTWPWAHLGFGLGSIIAAAAFWYFGTDLEKQIGRRPYAWLIGWSILIMGSVAAVLSIALPGIDAEFYDLYLLSYTVILLYIAEHPLRPFFFNIPAWVIGAVIVAIVVVQSLADREWIRFLSFVISAGIIALVARKNGLLAAYDKLPDLTIRRGSPGAPPRSARPTVGKPPKRGRLPSDTKRLWGRGKEQEPAEIVPMPPQRRSIPASSGPEVSADDLALDALLDKISDGGLDALTDDERQELADLRARRRKPSS